MKELYEKWRLSNLPSDLQNEIKAIAEDGQAIEDRFYQYVSFGTGGMRGILGAGTNRINIFTIRRVAEGLARYIESYGEEAKKRGAVIAYDTRHFSQEFAVETAGVLGAHGIKAFIYKEPRPTPQLSFTVRELNAFAGVVITASHNPKQYNGFKVYGADGAQLVPADAKQIVDHMEKIDDLFNITALEINVLESQGLVQWILEDFDEKYLEKLLSLKENSMIDTAMNIVYTPLHGAGLVPIMQGLKQFGFHNVYLVKEQAVQDGAFPTLPYPNPEDPEAFQYATELGEKVSADLILATDPDADRLGVAVRNGDMYEQLTGNQLGALLLHYIIQTHLQNSTLPNDGVLIKTIVTAELGAKIAAHYNIETVNTLTGFKYIAEKIEEYEKSGGRTFLFGYEESYGYLIKSFARDKDAVQIALKVSEMAAHYAAKGKTLLDVLDELCQEFGYHKETLVSRIFEGKRGREQMNATIDRLRESIPAEIAGVRVSRVEDYLASAAILADGAHEEITLPKENMMKIVLENDAWIAIRPSGTEPKCKYYFGVVGGSEAEAGQILERIIAGFISFSEAKSSF